MGDWTYYITSVSMREAVRHFKFAHEIVPYSELDHLIQRELSSRSVQIRKYLETNDQRLFGALTVAVYGGQPQFSPITIEASAVLRHLDGRIGVLSFDGDEDYYVLDGQHRLSAMKNLGQDEPNSSVLEDEISVLLVAHKRDPEGIQRARRLFTNLNRYAAKTSKTVNIVLDEDDAYAILTRTFLRDEAYLRSLTKVSKGTKTRSLATGESLSAGADRKYLLTITTFYECNKSLLNGRTPESFSERQLRPSDEDLERGYQSISSSWRELFDRIDFLRWCEEQGDSLDLTPERSPEGGHVLARPIGLRSFCEAVGELQPTEDGWARVGNVVESYSRIQETPWVDLLWKRDGKMFFGKDRISAAAGLWRLFLGVPVDRAKVEADWLAIVDPDRTQGLSLSDLGA